MGSSYLWGHLLENQDIIIPVRDCSLLFVLKMVHTYKLFSLLLLSTLLLTTQQAFTFDDSQYGVRSTNTTLKNIGCNKNSLNDFSFTSSSVLSCTSGSCSTTNPSQNIVTNLDVKNVQRSYILSSATVVTQTFIGSLRYAFLFTFVNPNTANNLYLAVPFDDSTKITGGYAYQAINLPNTTDSSFNNFIAFGSNPTTALTSGISLSSFNFLTTLNYNQFYSVMDSTFTNTILVSRTLLRITDSASVPSFTASQLSFTGDYANSADVLCWGQFSAGQFQTHMRESVPLWFFLLSTLLLWMFVLLGAENTPEVFERSFINNKWTSWSLYSLYNLAHEQFFSRMSRAALFYAPITWQAMVVSAIYSTHWGDSGDTIIIWAAVIAWVASIPFPYIFGNVFLKRIYQKQQAQLQKKIQEHQQIQKQKREACQRDAILLGEEVYSINYWYYSTILIMLGVFGILSVHVMQSVPSVNYFYRNWQWLISMGVIIGWQHLVVDPMLTCCFGDKPWYQSRGYYYNAELGECHRKAD